jgi:hypothetical protein
MYLVVRNLSTASSEEKPKYYEFLSTIHAESHIFFLSSPGLVTEQERTEFSKFLVMIGPSTFNDPVKRIFFFKELVRVNNPVTVDAIIDWIENRFGGGSSDLLASDPKSERGDLIHDVLEYARESPNQRYRGMFHRMFSSHRFAPEPQTIEMSLVTALASMGDKSVERVAARWVEMSDARVALAGLESLTYLGDDRVVRDQKYRNIVTQALMSGSYHGMVTALSAIDQPATIDILLELYNDPKQKYTFTVGKFTTGKYNGDAVLSLAKLKYPGVIDLIIKDMKLELGPWDADFEAIRYLEGSDKEKIKKLLISEIRTKRASYYTTLLRLGHITQTLDTLEFLGLPTFKEKILDYLKTEFIQNGTIPRESLETADGLRQVINVFDQECDRLRICG